MNKEDYAKAKKLASKEKLSVLREAIRMLERKKERSKKELPKPSRTYAQSGYGSTQSGYSPILTGSYSYTCSGCGQSMHYDGRCGDGPICMNSDCPKVIADNLERAYWANDRR